MKVKTRIAPSPTGAPHVGSAYVALFNYAFAKKHGGKFLLRIEDTDRARLVPTAEKSILEALNWLGLTWDEGPYRQSERLNIYQKYAHQLVEQDKAYYCFCSSSRLESVRAQAQKKGLPPRYDGLCRRLDPSQAKERIRNEKFVVRLKVPQTGKTSFNDLIRGEIEFENSLIDDQVLLKSDGFPTYHLAVVVDDYLMEVTHVLRGEEWISSTPKHILLYEAFGWKPPEIGHFPILREGSRAKLSKRHGSVGILEFKQDGYLSEAMLNFLALLGWSHPAGKEIFSLDEFVKSFDLARISTTAPVFDREKLDWMNGEYIRKLKDAELAERLQDYLKEHKGLRVNAEVLEKAVPLVKERIKKLSEFEILTRFIFNEVAWKREELILKGESPESVAERIQASQDALEPLDWDASLMESAVRNLAQEKGWKAPQLFMILRIAVTGAAVSPPLFESMEILGKEKTLSRLNGALEVLGLD